MTTVPFHEDFQGLDTLNVIQILLAIFLAFLIYGFDYFTSRRIQKNRKDRSRKAYNMLDRILKIQLQLLYTMARPDETGRVIFTTQNITNKDFVKASFPRNNSEILQIQGSYSDVIDDDLIEDLLAYTNNTSFIFSMKKDVTKDGLKEMVKTTNKLLDRIYEKLKKLN